MRLVCGCLALLCVGLAQAAELVQLSEEGCMALTVYPGQTRALVRETRPVALPAGAGSVCFAWLNPKVDGGSVSLAIAEVTVSGAIRPAGQDKVLIWNVDSPREMVAEAVFTYFLDGCRWQPSYRLFLAEDGQSGLLEGSLQLTNETGLDLCQAQLQVSVEGPGVIDRVTAGEVAPGPRIYPVPGPCALPQGETRHWQFLSPLAVPARVEGRFEVDKYGGAVQRFLVLDARGLDSGRLALLPAGSLTVHAAGEDGIPLLSARLDIPGAPLTEFDLGPEPDVVVERRLMDVHRDNVEFDRVGRVSGSDIQEDYILTIRNHLATEVTVKVTELKPSTWELKSEKAPDEKYDTLVRFLITAPAGASAELKFAMLKHSGSRVK